MVFEQRCWIAVGIDERTESQTRVREENYYIWERRFRGLCRLSEYYVARPAKRTVQESYVETTYQLQPDRIKVCLMPSITLLFNFMLR